jgi:dihydrofolate reductase
VIISLVVAMEEDGGIGLKGKIPWLLSADLQNFKRLTWGHHLIMGRKTFETIGRALPGRTSIVITRKKSSGSSGSGKIYSQRDTNKTLNEEKWLTAHSVQEALRVASDDGETEAFVIGGGQIYAQALPLAERIYLTQVHATLNCDVFFPRLEMRDWRVVTRLEHAADEHNQYAFTYSVLERTETRKIDSNHSD